MSPFWSYLYFHIPNFILAAVMYTLIGRMVLGLFVPANWDNYINRAFIRITDPVVNVVRFVTPSVLTGHAVLLFAVLWLMALRFAFGATLFRLDLLPKAV